MKNRTINILVLIFLIVLNFAANISKYQGMGLYEDDYELIGKPFNWTEQQYNNYMEHTLKENWVSGRPIGFTLPNTFGYLLREKNTLDSLYLIGLVILSANAFLCFLLFEQILGRKSIAILGAIMFSLFPPDTTKPLLLHIYQIQTSLLYTLLALYLFIKHPKMRFVSYILGIFTLFSYETPFTLFFLFPMFTDKKKDKKEWIKHFVIIGVILVGDIFLRLSMGETRVSSLGNWPTTIAQMIASVIIGPVVSLGLLFYVPARTVLHMNKELWFVMIASFPIMLGVMLWVHHQYQLESSSVESDDIKEVKIFSITIHLQDWMWKWIKMLGAAFLWVVSSYALSFSHFPPISRYGRQTSVHIASTLAVALFVTIFLWGMWRLLINHKRLVLLFFVIIAGYFSVTVGNKVSIQQDFVQSWTFQKEYWKQVIALIPDAEDGTTIFVVDHNLPKGHYIDVNSWPDQYILLQLYNFPVDWSRKPIVLLTDGNWETQLKLIDGKIIAPWGILWSYSINPDKVIILTDDSSGHLIRVDDAEISTLSGISIQAVPYQETDSLTEKYPTTRLYELMIEDMK